MQSVGYAAFGVQIDKGERVADIVAFEVGHQVVELGFDVVYFIDYHWFYHFELQQIGLRVLQFLEAGVNLGFAQVLQHRVAGMEVVFECDVLLSFDGFQTDGVKTNLILQLLDFVGGGLGLVMAAAERGECYDQGKE